MKYTDDQLLDRVESTAQGFVGWKRGVYLIAVRAKVNVPDAFDDKGYVFESKTDGQRPEFQMVLSLTTHTGTYGLKKFKDYNPKGCAVLKADTIVYNSHLPGPHKTYQAYRQAKGFPYYRDCNRDLVPDETGPEYNDVILANIHRASASKTSSVIYNWSVACIVLNNPQQFKAFSAYVGKRPVSLCILKEF